MNGSAEKPRLRQAPNRCVPCKTTTEMNPMEIFEACISNELTPNMKTLGFKKQNLNYFRNTGEIIQTFNIQRSQWNSSQHIKFTGNIGLTEPISYALINKLSKQPTQIKHYEAQFNVRLGQITDNEDYWYELNKSNQDEVVINKFRNDIKILCRFMESYESRNALLDLIKEKEKDSTFIFNPIDIYGLLKVSGQDKEAKEIFRKHYKELKEPTMLGKALKWLKGMVSDREISLELIRQKRLHFEEIAIIFGDSTK